MYLVKQAWGIVRRSGGPFLRYFAGDCVSRCSITL